MLPSFKPISALHLLGSLVFFLAALPGHGQNFRNPFRIPLTLDPYAVVAGDLNGDGRNDIVWTERSGTTILHVLLNVGNRQYTSAPDLSLSYYAPSIQCIIEDVTADKRNDLVCIARSSNYTDTFMLTYPGNGDGTFANPVQARIVSQVPLTNPILARAGDLNGDGVSDVIVMNAYDSGTLPLLSDGQGGFKVGTTFNGSFNFSIPTIADVNGDGKLDVLWPTGPRVNLGNGDGTFSPPVPYDPGYLSNCAFGDVDHDGHLDAACTWYDSGDLDGYIHFTVLHGNADGSFNKAPIFTRTFGTGEAESDGLATILSPVLIADLNGDGYADIISLSGDGYCVLMGGPNTTWNGQPAQFVASSVHSQQVFYRVSIADMNGDGLPDIVAIGPNGLYITYAQRDGTLSSAPAIEAGQVSTSAALVDVNNDGNLDIVSAGDVAIKLSLGRGDGTFRSPQPITTSGDFSTHNYVNGRVVSGDFNGDGKQDLLATGNVGPSMSQNYILFGHGDGTFDNPSPIPISLGEVVDLNNDGKSDVISIQNNASSTNLLIASLSRGDGTFSTSSTNLPVEIVDNIFTSPSVGPALADFRHLGRLDAVVASFNNAYVLRGHGDGTFDSTGATLSIPGLPSQTKTSVVDVASADFDGDGNLDVAVLAQYGNSIYGASNPISAVWVFYGNGDGTFTPASLAGTFNRDAYTLTAGDLNGDGLADLVLTSYEVYQDNGVLTINALPHRAWEAEADYTGGGGLSPLWIVDIDHDGRNDLVISNAERANPSSNSVAILLNKQNASVTGTLIANPEPSTLGAAFTLLATLSAPDGSSLAGTVNFSIDGVAVGSASILSNTAQVNVQGTAIGRHTLQADWAGDSTHPALTFIGSHFVIGMPTSLTLGSSLAPSLAGAQVTFIYALSTPSSSSSSTTAAGSITLTDNGRLFDTDTLTPSTLPFTGTFSTSTLSAGKHTITATYSGDSTYATSSATLTQIVTALPVALSLSASPNPANVGQNVQLKILALSTGCSTCAFSGQITLLEGSALLGTAAVAPDGASSLTVSFTDAGTHLLQAVFAGDAFHQGATATTNEQILRSDTSLSLKASLNPSPFGAPLRVTATLANAITVQPIASGAILFADGATILATVPVAPDGTAVLNSSTLAVGNHTLTANYQQTSSFNAASTSLLETIVRAQSSLSLTGTPNPVYQNAPLTLASGIVFANGVQPTGQVQFFDGTALIGSAPITASSATLITATLSVGQHVIQAVYPGDTQTEPSSSLLLHVTILPSDYELTSTPSSLLVQTAHHLTFVVTAQSVGAFSDHLQIFASNLPVHTTIRFTPDNVSLEASGRSTMSIYLDTDDVIGYAKLSSPRRQGHGYQWALAGAPLLLLGFARRRRGKLLLPLVCFVLISALLQGCSGKYPAFTAPGDYVIHLQATGMHTGLAHTLDVPMRVSE